MFVEKGRVPCEPSDCFGPILLRDMASWGLVDAACSLVAFLGCLGQNSLARSPCPLAAMWREEVPSSFENWHVQVGGEPMSDEITILPSVRCKGQGAILAQGIFVGCLPRTIVGSCM